MEALVEAGADVNYMCDRKIFSGLSKLTALCSVREVTSSGTSAAQAAQRAKDLGEKKILKYLESKGGKLEKKDKPLAL